MRYTVIENPDNIIWYKEGTSIRHRIGGPAKILPNGDKYWFQYDILHKLDGAAIEYYDGTKEYYILGLQFSEEEYKERIELMKEHFTK